MRTVSEFKVENYLDADADALIASRKLLHANVCWCCLAEGIMFDEQHKEKQLFTNCSMKNPHFEFHEISNHFSVSTLLAVGYSSNTVATSTVGSPDGGVSKESNKHRKSMLIYKIYQLFSLGKVLLWACIGLMPRILQGDGAGCFDHSKIDKFRGIPKD